jgi:hypothetical protein
MALGINEGINDADRAAVRDLLTNIGLGVSLAEEESVRMSCVRSSPTTWTIHVRLWRRSAMC